MGVRGRSFATGAVPVDGDRHLAVRPGAVGAAVIAGAGADGDGLLINILLQIWHPEVMFLIMFGRAFYGPMVKSSGVRYSEASLRAHKDLTDGSNCGHGAAQVRLKVHGRS